jgi:hypothetical protein
MKVQFFSAMLLVMLLFGCGNTDEIKHAENSNHISTLEGILQTHPKYLFKYYLTGFADGQQCALFGEDKLKNIKVGCMVHVEGRVGTRFHAGGNEQNPSPFPRTWYVFMEVEKVSVLREPGGKPNK